MKIAAGTYDLVIVGAGIVGLTTAREALLRNPGLKVLILEKESAPGMHASGRNSGVMHCGIYYGRDTLKAKVCANGAERMIAFASENGIAVNRNGKVIIATSENQLPTVEKLLHNAKDNGIKAEQIDHQQLRELEPYAITGAAAIYCPSTAVIDSNAVIKRLRDQLTERGVEFAFDCHAYRPGAKPDSLITSSGEVGYGKLINCAGAYADRLAKNYGLAKEYALVPFKGIYWKLSPAAAHKVRANIYPVPDIDVPFLGVHLTRVISGDVYVGPTAIPALGRENYGIIQGVNLTESVEIGCQLASMFIRNKNNFRNLALTEIRKYQKSHFLSAARKLVPSLEENDFIPTKKAGIRPQLVNLNTGSLEMDYIFEQKNNSLHVLNAISPAFTGSMAFSEIICEKIGI